MSVLGLPIRVAKFYNPELASLSQKFRKTSQNLDYLKEQKESIFPEFRSIVDPLIWQEQQTFNDIRDRISYIDWSAIQKGTSGSIFEVTHNFDSKKYALKLSNNDQISSYLIVNERNKLCFLNEEEEKDGKSYVAKLHAYIKIVNSLNHEVPALVLSLYRKDIFPERDEDLLSLKDTLKFLKKMLEILGFLKRKEVIHFDIKPENILVDCGGNYILADFGFSSFKNEGKIKGSTRQYASPEVSFGYKEFCDFSLDMWSTAATVCMVYAGLYIFGELDKKASDYPMQLTHFYHTQQNLFRRPYPEYLQIKLQKEEKAHFLQSPEIFENTLSFHDLMRQNCKALPEETSLLNSILDLLTQMFDLDYKKRISPEMALEQVNLLLSQIEEEKKLSLEDTGF